MGMRSRSTRVIMIMALISACIVVWWFRAGRDEPPFRQHHAHGDMIDSLNGVVVYCNGGFSGNSGRRVVDGYNIGLKFQCVEFVKRYYYERFAHRMPNSYGDASDFFDTAVADGALNKARGLLQFKNCSAEPPQEEDLVVFGPSVGNRFGHVAIIGRVGDGEVEVVQQNTGSTRSTYDLDLVDGRWVIDNSRILGWLRRP